MANPFGIGFIIGATVSSTVASAFSSVESKLQQTRQKLNAASREAKVFSTALDLRARRDEVKARFRASGGTDAALRNELLKINTEYLKARRAAMAYGAGVSEWSKRQQEARQRLELTYQRLKSFSALQEQANKRQELRGQMVGTAVGAMSLAAPVKMAMDFESAMAEAAKTIDGMRDDAGNLTPTYYEMERAVKSMGRSLPLTHAEIAGLFAAGGQQGMGDVKELEEFSTIAAHMSVAFGMSTEEAADAIGGYRSAMKLSLPEARSLLDLMNKFAGTSSASEKGIAEVIRRIGPLGNVGGVAAKPMAALAATLDAMKVAPEVAATSIKNLILAMTSGSAATKAQQEAFAQLGIGTVELAEQMQKDGPAAIISVLEAVQKLPKAQQLSIMQQIFGKESLGAITPLLDSLDKVKQNLIIAGNESEYAGAMQQEFENSSRTTAKAMLLFKNRVAELGITVGSVLLPPLVAIMDVAGEWVSSLAELAQQHQTLTTVLVSVAAGFVAFKIVSLGVVYAWSVLRTAGVGLSMTWNTMRMASRAYAAASLAGTWASLRASLALAWQRTTTVSAAVATKALAAGQWLLNRAMQANPIGLVIMGVVALAAGLIWLYRNCEPVRVALDALWKGIKVVGRYALAGLAFPFVMAFKVCKSVLGAMLTKVKAVWQAISEAASVAWDTIKVTGVAVKDTVIATWSNVSDFFSTHFSAVYDVCSSVWASIGSAISGVWDNVQSKAAGLFEWLSSKFEWLRSKFEWVGSATDIVSSSWDKAKSFVGLDDDDEKTKEQNQAPKREKGWFDSWFGGDDEEEPSATTAAPIASVAAPKQDQGWFSSWFGGDNEEEQSTTVAAPVASVAAPQQVFSVPKAAAPETAASVTGSAAPTQTRIAPETSKVRTPDMRLPLQTSAVERPLTPSMPALSANFDITLKGVPDASFAEGVVRAINERKSDIERILNDIVNNQTRLAYGR